MKRIIAFILSLFVITPSVVGMQAPKAANTQEVVLDEPHLTEKNRLEICAYFNKQKIGHIQYKSSEEVKWYICEIKVNSEHRKSDKKVGSKLFSECLKNICAQKPQKIYWYLSRIEKDSPSMEELEQIYTRMISKLTLPKHTLIKDGFEKTTYMALEFDIENPNPIVQAVCAPIYNQEENEYKIEAFNAEGSNMGYIFYKPILQNRTLWTISELWVDNNYRNQGLGLKLLKSCFEHIKQQNGTKVTSFINSFDSKFDRYETAAIYSRMFSKMDKNNFKISFETSERSIIVNVEF